LIGAGMRPINNVVDITNYVMLMTAQPLHAFDLDKVPDGELIIRTAKPHEKMTTLDGVERTFDDDAVLVCDRDGPSGIAGIMGGEVSEVSETTTRVLLEVATWNGVNILRSSRRLGLRSEYVPGAEAVHLYNRSAAKEPRSQQWFEESAHRFRRLHYGSGFTWLLERRKERPAPELPLLKEVPVEAGSWVEVSPNPAGFPAATERVSASGLWRLPEEIAGRLEGSWTVQVTDGKGRELVRGRL